MDSGFSHKPKHLGSFLEKLDAGYDAVFGSRFSKDSKYKATFLNEFYIVIYNFIYFLNILFSKIMSRAP